MAALCIQTSRASGLHAPGRGLAGKAASPWAKEGGRAAHSVNPAHKSSRGDQRGEARSNTSEEELRGREQEFFGLIFFFFLGFFFVVYHII